MLKYLGYISFLYASAVLVYISYNIFVDYPDDTETLLLIYIFYFSSLGQLYYIIETIKNLSYTKRPKLGTLDENSSSQNEDNFKSNGVTLKVIGWIEIFASIFIVFMAIYNMYFYNGVFIVEIIPVIIIVGSTITFLYNIMIFARRQKVID